MAKAKKTDDTTETTAAVITDETATSAEKTDTATILTPPPDKEQQGSFVYIGPAVPGGALPSNRILKGTREEVNASLAEVLEKYPQVGNLIVEVGKLAVSKAKVKAANNILGKNYAELKAAFAKGV